MLSEKPWQLDAVLRLLLGIFVSIAIGGLVGQVLISGSGGGSRDRERILFFLIGTLSFQGTALILIGFFLREHGLGWREAFGFSQGPLGSTVTLAALVAAVSLPCALSLAEVSAAILSAHQFDPVEQTAVQTLKTTESPAARYLLGVVAILLAPVVEEILFRGILYPALKQRMRRFMALWSSAILFAAIHNNLMTFLPLTFLAVMLTLLYEETDNLLAPIVTHCLFNAANFYWLMDQRQLSGG